jgi:flavin reductase (DIM6/NTAB) family NADH-FMN oxidoreductase RutF
MTVDHRTYLDALSSFATGVTIITAPLADGIHGMTANAFTSLSLSPMQIIICLAKKAKMAGELTAGHVFTVNVLSSDQDRLSTHFAGVAVPNMPPVQFQDWEGGVRLQRCHAAIGCHVAAQHDGGDHWIVIGAVCAVYQSGDAASEPLLYYQRKYAWLQSARTDAPDRLDWEEGTPVMFYDPW